LRNRLLIRLAEHLEWSTYQRAGLVWAVTEGIRTTLIGRGLPTEKIFLLTNGVDTGKFRAYPQAQARTELDLPSSFLVLYAGTHGIAQGLMTVIEAAERLRECVDIRFVLAGDGAEKQTLIAEARQRGLSNILFLDPLSHERMPLLWSASDVCLVPLRKLPLFEGALPSKMYEAMACTRPIILGVAGEARKLLEKEAKSAIAVEPENVDELVSAILYLYKHPEERERLGKQARAFVEGRFDRSQLVSTLQTHMDTLLKQHA
jgi:glycosyltransferase involved in cell wall biosynthesis